MAKFIKIKDVKGKTHDVNPDGIESMKTGKHGGFMAAFGDDPIIGDEGKPCTIVKLKSGDQIKTFESKDDLLKRLETESGQAKDSKGNKIQVRDTVVAVREIKNIQSQKTIPKGTKLSVLGNGINLNHIEVDYQGTSWQIDASQVEKM